ncbi:MAG TPA: hypothetical protein IAB06_03940 [Candidatus Avacidaminococcus intestinavium]|uniref:Uncharacterized protein n=1 Tax=Candidatus Avacidaminococcus intestinavium TaxID=2840684 RepID=A0A9D1SL23_9FIRM|nr:hypothetical protein [Candidatus Avacidaminococcus intestinavium]
MKKFYIVGVVIWFAVTGFAIAAERNQFFSDVKNTDSSNMVRPYYTYAEVLPPKPEFPKNMEDVQAMEKYKKDVQSYLVQLEEYIKVTNKDAQSIAQERVAAQAAAKELKAEYNSIVLSK